MKIKNVEIQGFRGFNQRRTIEFDGRLTLVCAPNSYGKTSISEAVEWLLYGITSKVDKADSKDEYKGSYRNRHFPGGATPFVRATFVDDNGNEIVFRGDLADDESIRRSVDGQEVEGWPLGVDLSKVPKPFILQHALKNLLLVRPIERFQGFAKLLGLEELDEFGRDVVSLCTKPEACIPGEVSRLLNRVSVLEGRVANQPSLGRIHKALKQGTGGLERAYEAVACECRKRVPAGTLPDSVVPQLLRIREEAVSSFFEGRVVLGEYAEQEKDANGEDEHFLLTCVADPFLKKYMNLLALATLEHVLERARFFGLGVKLLGKVRAQCPFCGQSVDEDLLEHIHGQHASLAAEKERSEALEEQRAEVIGLLSELAKRLHTYHTRQMEKTAVLLGLEPNLDKLKAILAPQHQVHFSAVEEAVLGLAGTKNGLETCYREVLGALDKVQLSVSESKEDAGLVEALAEGLAGYISGARSYVQEVSDKVPAMCEADQILKHELDALAGTEDISVLIDLREQRQDVEKKYEIEEILNGLKDLRKSVDQFTADTVLEAISGDLSAEVMRWYEQMKTEGDPDVHFDGFDMERTRKGTLKAGRIQIKAKSYDKELVSAVSSLSESKLNALGLCMCIATNFMGESPFDFLIIDDPIQSWDAEHETQFIEVTRKLVDRGKQVILMSHNRPWVQRLCAGCRTINGRFYEITGYTEAGPHIRETAWVRWKERLREVDAIVRDESATSVKLQHGEEEIRIVNAEITSELYCKTKGVWRSPHNLNSSRIRKMLVECGVDSALVDRITETFGTTDDAHHAGVDYVPDRQRIRRYHSWAHELGKLLDDS